MPYKVCMTAPKQQMHKGKPADLELASLALQLCLQHLLLTPQPLYIIGSILITSSLLTHSLHQQVILLNDICSQLLNVLLQL